MTQADRDRLVALKKARKRLITQREAAVELGLSVRQVKRLMHAMKKRGDKAVIHGLRGLPSTHKIDEEVQRKAVDILSTEDYRGFGPTLALEGKIQPGRGHRPAWPGGEAPITHSLDKSIRTACRRANVGHGPVRRYVEVDSDTCLRRHAAGV